MNNIDSRDEDGWTALHAAVYWENMEVAKLLVQKGACVNAVTKTVRGGACRGVNVHNHKCILFVARETLSMTYADPNMMIN